MTEISTLDPSEAPRARRWDALILGSGVSALVAAARMSATGLRVLVVEEEARTMLPPALREPFFLAGYRDRGLLDATLRALAVPLIDRRRLGQERLAYQIADDPYRLEVGQPLLMAEEFVNWGLAKPEEAQLLVRRLVEASNAERDLLAEAPFVRLGRRIPRPQGSAQTEAAAEVDRATQSHRRGLPSEVRDAKGGLARALRAQVEALCNLGQETPSPEAIARLLGLGLAGGAGFSDQPPWLIDLLRKRVTALYGDTRTLSGDFEVVSVSGHPGIRMLRSGEIWLGRALVLAAPLSALRDGSHQDEADDRRATTRPAPDLLAPARSRAYRAALLYRVPTALLPEGMGARVLLPGRTDREPTLALTAFPCQTQPNHVDLVVRAVLPSATRENLGTALEDLRAHGLKRLTELMPFSEGRIESIDLREPRWDSDDGWLEDPNPGEGWPGEVELRLSGRPPIYHLNRSAAAGLGLEGDLLLGWRGGDAIAGELA